MKVFATYNIKGGVGKTSTAVNLAYLAAREGRRTLLWDLDPQGAATFLLRVKPFVKGGAERLAGKKGALEPHLHGSDHAGMHVVPADF
ncbi:MAG: ParA family protein, partial [Aeromicrobium sp.]